MARSQRAQTVAARAHFEVGLGFFAAEFGDAASNVDLSLQFDPRKIQRGSRVAFQFSGLATLIAGEEAEASLVPTIPEEYEKLGSYALYGLPESLYATRFIKPDQLDTEYPIVVAGKNFGCGSSREHAPIALGSAGCKVVLAESFARIFFRNSVATGELYPCEATDRLCDVLKTGDVITVDLDKTTVTVEATGKTFSFKPLGDVRPVVDAGGLFNYARKSGMIAAHA